MSISGNLPPATTISLYPPHVAVTPEEEVDKAASFAAFPEAVRDLFDLKNYALIPRVKTFPPDRIPTSTIHLTDSNGVIYPIVQGNLGKSYYISVLIREIVRESIPNGKEVFEQVSFVLTFGQDRGAFHCRGFLAEKIFEKSRLTPFFVTEAIRLDGALVIDRFRNMMEGRHLTVEMASHAAAIQPREFAVRSQLDGILSSNTQLVCGYLGNEETLWHAEQCDRLYPREIIRALDRKSVV